MSASSLVLFMTAAAVFFGLTIIGFNIWFDRRDNPRTVRGHKRRAWRIFKKANNIRPTSKAYPFIVSLVASFRFYQEEYYNIMCYNLDEGYNDEEYDAWLIVNEYYQALRALGLNDGGIDSIARLEKLDP